METMIALITVTLISSTSESDHWSVSSCESDDQSPAGKPCSIFLCWLPVAGDPVFQWNYWHIPLRNYCETNVKLLWNYCETVVKLLAHYCDCETILDNIGHQFKWSLQVIHLEDHLTFDQRLKFCLFIDGRINKIIVFLVLRYDLGGNQEHRISWELFL